MVSPHQLRTAARTLREGGVIAYPTEAVFGLGCDPANAAAVLRLLKLKSRSMEKGLILIAAAFEDLAPLLEPLPPTVQEKLDQSWPGPVTWLVPARPEVPEWLRGSHTSLAVRVTAHGPAAALCHAFGGPIVSTSANLAGHPPARTALQVRRSFGNGIDYVLPGETGPFVRPSEIRDAMTDRVVRAG